MPHSMNACSLYQSLPADSCAMLTEPFAMAPTELDQETNAGEEWLCFVSFQPGELFGALLPECLCWRKGEKN